MMQLIGPPDPRAPGPTILEELPRAELGATVSVSFHRDLSDPKRPTWALAFIHSLFVSSKSTSTAATKFLSTAFTLELGLFLL